MPYTTIRDNRSNGKVGDFLKETISEDSSVSIVSAYFTIYAYNQLKENLDKIKDLRFLFGEPTFIKAMDTNKSPREFKIEDDKLVIPVENRLSQKRIARECADWIRHKVEIRSMVKPNFLHGKLYHITQKAGIEKAIAGSSNFTVNGLGFGLNSNMELNLIIDSDRERKEIHEWFNQLWNGPSDLIQDVKEEVLRYLNTLYAENSPEFIYHKTLYHLFEEYLTEQKRGGFLDENTGFYNSEVWNMLYDFQKDGVKGAINKITKHNGCIIADSVGLGKTFEALAVIKYFELLNYRVLVLCPKKLSGNWSIYQANQNHVLNPFKKDRFNYTLMYHTDLGRERGRSSANGIDLETFNWGAFDLIVLDESHNFRGNPMERTTDEGEIRYNRAKWLMEKMIKSGIKTKILMLSATPVNNELKDLRNQISYITEGKSDALLDSSKIDDINLTLKNAQTKFTNWANRDNPDKSMKKLLEELDSSFFKLLDELTIARSRKHIVKFYDVASVGNFPKRKKPLSLYPNIDLTNQFPSYDKINKIIQGYKLSVYNPSAFLQDDKKEKYERIANGQNQRFKQADREGFLIGMMKVNYLKRLESSIESFEISLNRTLAKINRLIDKIVHYQIHQLLQDQIDTDLCNPDDEDIENSMDDNEDWQVGKKLKFDLADLKLDEWLEALEKDKIALEQLHQEAKKVDASKDAKLATLKEEIEKKVRNPINQGNKKVLIFTAFSDTAEYLYHNLLNWVRHHLQLHIALVGGSITQTSYGRNDFENILLNFSPKSKNRNQLFKEQNLPEIDVLIATDCISEGQNLQDCDYLINYDIHWNPVRIIQRFGRIDRLGSQNASIQLVNFWPTSDLDNYINLKERVEARMALVDMTATGEDNILNTEQLNELISDDLRFRNKQLKKLKEEVLDLEDMEENISLTDFSLNDFRIEIDKYFKQNSDKIKNSPLGLYAVVPSPGGEYAHLTDNHEISAIEIELIKPGLIFCLSHKTEFNGLKKLNPLYPHFLVYIKEDGTVQYNYTHAKYILDIYRTLCQNKNTPYQALCDLFNQKTEDSENMNEYTLLLGKTVESITRLFTRRERSQLQTNRRAVITSALREISRNDDFELVTWLIIL